MPAPLQPTDETAVRLVRGCIECDATDEVVSGQLVEVLLARRGHASVRVVLVDGVEVHRCESPFLMMF